MKKLILWSIAILAVFAALISIRAAAGIRKHDFQGMCQTCHTTTPDKTTEARDITFTDSIDRLCAGCHSMSEEKSHPINVKPEKAVPLMGHLDKNGNITCTTCHDVHKEDKTAKPAELPGLLWGHVKGRAFCDVCHNSEGLGAKWQHQTAIQYAHPDGKLTQDLSGAVLDRYSIECLSCHDGTVSKSPSVEVRQGVWQHGIGESHPIGVDYPREDDFADPESLPPEIRLFNGRVGCLSCHEIYSKESEMLVINNRGSRLCMTCHKK